MERFNERLKKKKSADKISSVAELIFKVCGWLIFDFCLLTLLILFFSKDAIFEEEDIYFVVGLLLLSFFSCPLIDFKKYWLLKFVTGILSVVLLN